MKYIHYFKKLKIQTNEKVYHYHLKSHSFLLGSKMFYLIFTL